MRQHPQTLWRTGDLCRLSFSRAVYRVDGVAAGGNVTIMPCSDAGNPQQRHATSIVWPETEDVPEDPRELAILDLETGQFGHEGSASQELAVEAYRAVRDVEYGPEGPKNDPDIDGFAHLCLLAAALLRDGWSPGDPMEVLP